MVAYAYLLARVVYKVLQAHHHYMAGELTPSKVAVVLLEHDCSVTYRKGHHWQDCRGRIMNESECLDREPP